MCKKEPPVGAMHHVRWIQSVWVSTIRINRIYEPYLATNYIVDYIYVCVGKQGTCIRGQMYNVKRKINATEYLS
jgi:hypothetical protein